MQLPIKATFQQIQVVDFHSDSSLFSLNLQQTTVGDITEEHSVRAIMKESLEL